MTNNNNNNNNSNNDTYTYIYIYTYMTRPRAQKSHNATPDRRPPAAGRGGRAVALSASS